MVVNVSVELNEVLIIAKNYIKDDRFSLSGNFTKLHTLNRIRYYLEKACNAENEFLLCLKNEHSGEIIGYQSGRISSKNEVHLYLSGLRNE